MYAATGGPNGNWGHRFEMEGPGTTAPPFGDGPGHGPALLQPDPPGANKKPPGPFMLNYNLFSGPDRPVI